MFEVLKTIFGNWKTFFATTFVTTILCSAWDYVLLIIKYGLEKILSLITDIVGPSPIMIEFTGIGAYFATVFKFPECLSVIFISIVMRFTLVAIPFSPFRK